MKTTYAERLAEAWQAHLAPPADDAPTVVSTFAGAGGSSLGYSMAGYRELLAVEWEDHAASCLRRNFPHVQVHHGDITHVDPGMLDLAPGELDVFDGSPPCQGFSTVGKRQLDDPRNQLFRQYIRLIDAWQPKVFVMENVSGMVKGQMKGLFAEILTTLKAAGTGYQVVARLLDASYCGVPQMRKRMIFVGVRSDLGIAPAHPAPTTRPVTVREAIADLDDPGDYLVPKGKLAGLARLIPPGRNGADALGARGGGNSYFGVARLHFDRPSFTILKSMRPYTSGFLHPREDRFLGVRELSRLQSFPDAYDWGDSKYEDVYARIGNSVPPLMMRAIATTIHERILIPAALGGG